MPESIKKSHDLPTFMEWDHIVIRVKGFLVVSGHGVFIWTVSYFGWSGFTLLGFSFVFGISGQPQNSEQNSVKNHWAVSGFEFKLYKASKILQRRTWRENKFLQIQLWQSILDSNLITSWVSNSIYINYQLRLFFLMLLLLIVWFVLNVIS